MTEAPPGFLRLAGHPLRWRLLAELARSDRQVRELTGLLGERQSLVSYHLGRLRDGGLVAARRSSADGRDAYYRIDMTRCGELLASAGRALHPGLAPPAGGFPVPGLTPSAGGSSVPGLSPSAGLAPARVPEARGPEARRPEAVRVLFLCTGNSTRSQMAEALARRLGGGAVEAVSAGSRPRPLHPDAVRAMREHGIDIRGQRAKHMDTFGGQRFGYVVSLCDRVREICPEFPGHPEAIHWSIPDPAGEPDGYQAFRRVAAELRTRVGFLIARIASDAGG